ncbi:hypothetical protein JXD38_10930 [candidate division WOR-3 bacterium]|nr:hypothetical protein [candidate division WOR-3 bacterium]
MKMSQLSLVGSAVTALFLLAAPTLARTAPAARSSNVYDVGLVDFTLWDTVCVGDTYRFNQVAVANYSVVPAPVWFEVGLPSGYADRTFLFLPIGGTQTVSWWLMPMVFESAGVYLGVRCTLEWSRDEDPTNNGRTKHVVVLPRHRTRNAEAADCGPRRPAASYSTQVLRTDEPGASWYTTTGIRVRSSAARPGIYFKVQGRTVRKVVLIR